MVAEKNPTENFVTDRQTEGQTDRHTKVKNSIPPIPSERGNN